MIKGITSGGFSFKIDEEARDDMELLETISQLDSGEMELLPKVIEMLLGKKQKDALYEHCRGKSGRVSAKKVMNEIKSIFDNIKESESKTKNL